jgi:alpha-tubulin suppressor-like RCC1 family protein
VAQVVASGTEAATGERWAHSCAVEAGSVFCWGANDRGELGGDFPTAYRTEPTRGVPVSDAVALGAGEQHTCVIRKGGALECWGANEHGQLGNGTFDDARLPVLVHLPCP